MAIIRNLQAVPHSESVIELKKMTQDFFVSVRDKTEGLAYQLSMPLMASAQLGDKELFNQIFMAFIEALEKNTVPQNWLPLIYGRFLFATNCMGYEQAYVKTTKTQLKSMINPTNVLATKDEFSAWAWGYLAGLNAGEYYHAKKTMQKSAESLTKKFHKDPTQAARSNAFWAWIMVCIAAARASDEFMYHYALGQMKEITQEKTVGAALQKGLLRSDKSNDYPLWGTAVVQLAASIHKDAATYRELDALLNNALPEASVPEAMLAKVNRELARQNEPAIESKEEDENMADWYLENSLRR